MYVKPNASDKKSKEIYILGLEKEAKKYAQILGYNYQSSEWYKKSYKIFNQDYKVLKKTEKKENKKLIDKIRSFF